MKKIWGGLLSTVFALMLCPCLAYADTNDETPQTEVAIQSSSGESVYCYLNIIGDVDNLEKNKDNWYTYGKVDNVQGLPENVGYTDKDSQPGDRSKYDNDAIPESAVESAEKAAESDNLQLYSKNEKYFDNENIKNNIHWYGLVHSNGAADYTDASGLSWHLDGWIDAKYFYNYIVTFQDEDGTVYSKTGYFKGDSLIVPSNPTKAADAQYTYTFNGWDKDLQSPVTDNAVYTATWNKTVNEYAITWIDEDGTVLETDSAEYGSTPEYNGETPTKAEDATYTYEFDGWTPAIETVTGNATYQAQYKATYKEYTVSYSWTGDLPYGLDDPANLPPTEVLHNGDIFTVLPTYEEDLYMYDENYNVTGYYHFSGWDIGNGEHVINGEDVEIHGTWTYTAVDVPVTPIDEDNGTVKNYASNSTSNSVLPKTGDNTMIIFIALLLAMSAAGILIFKMRKYN